MITTPALTEAQAALGIQAPPCGECEDGVIHYCDGPYAMTRECETCQGHGTHLTCPHCLGGAAGDGDCPVCDGAGGLC
ncbi:hypothetical protein [Streptomyces olivoreticuli]|uniref:hypothetical protein n=1 Tax=Streptomyces olivoreticuli TaxID=68246 RepID=UPI000E2496B4|nr:hypothetical protein [Streptomyces olivoreticuli]